MLYTEHFIQSNLLVGPNTVPAWKFEFDRASQHKILKWEFDTVQMKSTMNQDYRIFSAMWRRFTILFLTNLKTCHFRTKF